MTIKPFFFKYHFRSNAPVFEKRNFSLKLSRLHPRTKRSFASAMLFDNLRRTLEEDANSGKTQQAGKKAMEIYKYIKDIQKQRALASKAKALSTA